MTVIKKIGILLGLHRIVNGITTRRMKKMHAMRFPAFNASVHEDLCIRDDYVRYACIALAIDTVLHEELPGNFAEVGVFRGTMSAFIHRIAPQRRFYLFDTFEGFSKKDLPQGFVDERFKDTAVEQVLAAIGDSRTIVVRKGYVPDTFIGLESESFAFALLDLDLLKPTLASLEFFYPRLSRGGYMIIHDYNNDESDWACKRAVDGFMKDKPEKIIAIPDVWGTALFRKS